MLPQAYFNYFCILIFVFWILKVGGLFFKNLNEIKNISGAKINRKYMKFKKYKKLNEKLIQNVNQSKY